MEKVTIVIPSWNGEALLRRTLPTVLQLRGDYEVIVVDNGFRVGEGSEDYVAGLGDARIRYLKYSEQLGYAAAVNRGVDHATTDLIAILGNDNEVPADWLEQMWKIMQPGRWHGRDIGAVMARTEMSSLDTSYRGTMNLFGRNIMFADDRWQTEPMPIFYPGGNALLFRKSVIQTPYEDFYFTYHEDVFLGWRLHNKGYAVLHYYPAHVNSFDGGSTKRREIRFRTEMLSERNRMINLLIFPEFETIMKLGPLWDVDFLLRVLFSRTRLAKLAAAWWVLTHPRFLWRLRKRWQAERQVTDETALSAMSTLYFSETATTPRWKKWVNAAVLGYCRLVGVQIGKGLSE